MNFVSIPIDESDTNTTGVCWQNTTNGEILYDNSSNITPTVTSEPAANMCGFCERRILKSYGFYYYI